MSIAEVLHNWTVIPGVSPREVRFKSLRIPEKPVYGYPEVYRPLPLLYQVNRLINRWPILNDYTFSEGLVQKVSASPLCDGAEAWFAIPYWKRLSLFKGQAIRMVIDALREGQGLTYPCRPKFDFEIQSMGLDMEEVYEQQQSSILFIQAQFGLKHDGRLENEFDLGLFELLSMLLTHEQRMLASSRKAINRTLGVRAMGDMVTGFHGAAWAMGIEPRRWSGSPIEMKAWLPESVVDSYRPVTGFKMTQEQWQEIIK